MRQIGGGQKPVLRPDCFNDRATTVWPFAARKERAGGMDRGQLGAASLQQRFGDEQTERHALVMRVQGRVVSAQTNERITASPDDVLGKARAISDNPQGHGFRGRFQINPNQAAGEVDGVLDQIAQADAFAAPILHI